MSDLRHVLVDRDEDLTVVTIDRPKKLNALNSEVMNELAGVFEELEADTSVRGVVLTGAGEKAFVVGADIEELARMDSLSGVELSRRGQRVLLAIERFPKPVLAAVGGYAFGGGCELALACHLRIASDNARFGLPEVGLGIIPGYGGTVRLARIIGLGRAVEMILTGEPISATQAEAVGLVSGVVPRSELLARAKELLRKVTVNAPVAVRLALASIYHAQNAPTSDALEFEASLFGLLASTDDMREGMASFLGKRKPAFRGR